MRTLSPAQLAFLLVAFLLVPLLNVLLAVWRRRRGPGAAARPPEPRAQEVPAPATRPRAGQAARVGQPRREILGIPLESAPGSRRLTAAARLGPRDARRGVILSTILGPCRALEPRQPPVPEVRDPAAPSSLAR